MLFVCFSLQYYFTVLFGHEGQKPLELRCEEQQDGKEWMEAIHQARYVLCVTLGCLVFHWYVTVGGIFGNICSSKMSYPSILLP